jgi:hypothetical protein
MCQGNTKCKDCKNCNTEAVISELQYVIEQNPKEFDDIVGVSLTELPFEERMMHLRNAAKNEKSRNRMASIILRRLRDKGVVIGSDRARPAGVSLIVSGVEEPVLGSNGFVFSPEVSAYMDASMQQVSDSQNSAQTPTKDKQDVGEILQGSAAVIDSVSNIIGMFVGGGSISSNSQIGYTEPTTTQKTGMSTGSIVLIGILAAGAIGVTIWVLTRKK